MENKKYKKPQGCTCSFDNSGEPLYGGYARCPIHDPNMRGSETELYDQINKLKSDCSQHKKELFGQTDMKVVAEAIGDLHYETLTELFEHICDKLIIDAAKDRGKERMRLANCLEAAANNLQFAGIQIEYAWEVCKPFMNTSPSPKK